MFSHGACESAVTLQEMTTLRSEAPPSAASQNKLTPAQLNLGEKCERQNCFIPFQSLFVLIGRPVIQGDSENHHYNI